MDRVDRLSDYDAFAWVYNKEWGPKHSGLFFSIVESLALRELRPGAHILDLCCGTGHVAAMLAERGYRVTGVDASEEMLRFARQNAPTAEFVLDDARRFRRPEAFDAVVSTFDSLNHVMRSEELSAVFRNVHASLRAGGVFLFDLNTERNYKEQWRGSFGIVRPEPGVKRRRRPLKHAEFPGIASRSEAWEPYLTKSEVRLPCVAHPEISKSPLPTGPKRTSEASTFSKHSSHCCTCETA